MPNTIKTVAGGLALQVTHEVRAADLVSENPPDDPGPNDTPPHPTSRAKVRIHAFEDLLLVVDRDTDHVRAGDAAELVATAARDTDTAYDAQKTSVQIKGHGYQLQLPPAADAGFREGDPAPVLTAPGTLFIHAPIADARRLAEDLLELRHAQLEE